MDKTLKKILVNPPQPLTLKTYLSALFFLGKFSFMLWLLSRLIILFWASPSLASGLVIGFLGIVLLLLPPTVALLNPTLVYLVLGCTFTSGSISHKKTVQVMGSDHIVIELNHNPNVNFMFTQKIGASLQLNQEVIVAHSKWRLICYWIEIRE